MEQQNFHSPRIIQLDFFRGVALMVIFINHMPFNDWFFWTPSRFGFSDAAEAFVFISGFVAALSYGRSFEQMGLGIGTLRILLRCAQIYACHLASFFLLAAICVFGNEWKIGPDYIQRLNIQYFFDNTQQAVAALFALRYVPNFFDILPMYLAMMLWIPLVWSLSRLHRALAVGFPLLVYLAAWLLHWELLADPVSGRAWYFNPFTWQLMFFTGFALGAKWVPIPEPNGFLLLLTLLFILLAIPLGHEPTYGSLTWLGDGRQQLEPWLDKSHLGLLRWVHFLALAYVASYVSARRPAWLGARWSRCIAQMGRQALPMFLLCMAFSYMGGIALDKLGRDSLSVASVNLVGLAAMLLSSEIMAWLHAKPWRSVCGPMQAQWSNALALSLLTLLALTPWLALRMETPAAEIKPAVANNTLLAAAERVSTDDGADDLAAETIMRAWWSGCLQGATQALDTFDGVTEPPNVGDIRPITF